MRRLFYQRYFENNWLILKHNQMKALLKSLTILKRQKKVYQNKTVAKLNVRESGIGSQNVKNLKDADLYWKVYANHTLKQDKTEALLFHPSLVLHRMYLTFYK